MKFFNFRKNATSISRDIMEVQPSAESELVSHNPDSIRSNQIIIRMNDPRNQLGSKAEFKRPTQKSNIETSDDEQIDRESYNSIESVHASMSFDSHIVKNFIELKATMDLGREFTLKLLYRASEHDFDVGKFHSFCRDIPHTLFLAEISNGNIIGGYTPLSWRDSYNKEGTHYKTDKNDKSFLFNFTSSEKYKIMKQSNNKAILACKFLGPTFGGGHDFCIGNHANRKYSSSCNFPASYNKETDLKNYKVTRRSLIGISDTEELFLIKEWEIFEVCLNTEDDMEQDQEDRNRALHPLQGFSLQPSTKRKQSIWKQLGSFFTWGSTAQSE